MSAERSKVLETAQKHLAKGHYDKAIAEYLKLVRADPKDVRTWLKIGDLYTRKGARREACETYGRVADQYAEQGFYLKAVAVYRRILELDNTKLDVYVKLGEAYEHLQLISDALNTYEHVATAYARAGEIDKALATLEQMCELDPQNIPVRIKYAEALSKGGKTKEAADSFEIGAELLKEHGRIDDYIKVAERLLFHRPDDAAVAKELAGIYIERNDAKRALAKLQLCFKADPRDVATLELLALAFRILDQIPKTISVYREIARLHKEADRTDLHASALRKILELDPRDHDARTVLDQIEVVNRRPAPRPPRPGSIEPRAPRPSSSPQFESPPRPAVDRPPPPPAGELDDDDRAAPGYRPDLGPPHISGDLDRDEHGAAHDHGAPAHLRGRIDDDDDFHAPGGTEDDEDYLPGESSYEDVSADESLMDVSGESDAVIILPDEESDVASLPARAAAEGPRTDERRSDEDVVLLNRPKSEPPAPRHPTSIPPDIAREAHIARLMTDCEVFLRYGLKTKVVDQLHRVLEVEPNHVEAREKLKDVYIELGRNDDAVNQLSALADILGVETPGVALLYLRQAVELGGAGFGDRIRKLEAASAERRSQFPSQAPTTTRQVGGDVWPAPEDEGWDAPEVRGKGGDSEADSGVLFIDEDSSGEPWGDGAGDRTEVESAADAEAAYLNNLPPAPPELDEELVPLASRPPSSPDLDDEGLVPLASGPPLRPELDDEDLLPLASRPPAPPDFDEELVPLASRPPSRPVSPPPPPPPASASDRPYYADIPPPPRTADLPPIHAMDRHAMDDRLAPMSPQEFEAAPLTRTESDQHEGAPLAKPAGEIEEVLEEAEFFLAQGVWDEARTTIQEALKSHPDHPLLLDKMQEVEELAAAAGPSAVASAPPAPNVLPADDGIDIDESFLLAERLAEEFGPIEETPAQDDDMLDVEAVFEQFKKGVAETIGADDTDTHFDLGIAYKEMGLLNDAIREFDLALRVPNKECVAQTMIGLCFVEKGDVPAAINHFKKGLYAVEKSDREELGLYFELGSAYELIDDPKEALYYFEKVEKRDPGFRDVKSRVVRLMSPENQEKLLAFGEEGLEDVDQAFDDLISEGD